MPVKPMGWRVLRSALVDGRTLRLGHGVRIAEDIAALDAGDADVAGLGEVARWVLERGIPLELSPSQTCKQVLWRSGNRDGPAPV